MRAKAGTPEKLAIKSVKAKAKRQANILLYLLANSRVRHRAYGTPYSPPSDQEMAEMQAALTKPCRICLREMVYKSKHGPSIDRHDNNKGYQSGNYRIICRSCNSRKSDVSPEELMRLALYAAEIDKS